MLIRGTYSRLYIVLVPVKDVGLRRWLFSYDYYIDHESTYIAAWARILGLQVQWLRA